MIGRLNLVGVAMPLFERVGALKFGCKGNAMQAMSDGSFDSSFTADARVEEQRFVTSFGMSSEHFMRELKADFEQATPEQRAEFEHVVDQANAVLPEMNAALDRIGGSLNGMRATMETMQESMASLSARVVQIEQTFETDTAAQPCF